MKYVLDVTSEQTHMGMDDLFTIAIYGYRASVKSPLIQHNAYLRDNSKTTNQQNYVTAVKEFRRIKRIRRTLMFPYALRKMKLKQLDNLVFFQVDDEITSRLLASKRWLLRSLKPVVSLWMVVKTVHDIVKDFVTAELQQRGCLQDTIFLQDGAPLHIDHRVKELLKQYFTDAWVISHHFSTVWPPRSPDMALCNFRLWGSLKDF
ncbi:uncharacterized protein TNCV_333421 [Trichonephila clavipes]|nr:uncharacterized protein TNCV_333421 [Trichonephila clavipes]